MNKFMSPKDRCMTHLSNNGLGEVHIYNPADPEGSYGLKEIADEEHLKAIAARLNQLENQVINWDAFHELNGEEAGALIAKLLSGAVNGKGAQTVMDALNKGIRSDHRQLQAYIYEGFLKLIRDVAKDYENQRYDGRNAIYVRALKAATDHIFIHNDTYLNPDVLPPDTVGF